MEVRVVDLDGDGAAEVVFNTFYANLSGPQNWGGVYALKSGNDPWMPARKLHNQWGYTTTAINDDLTVPLAYVSHVQQSATNLFGQQRQLSTRPDLRTRSTASFTYAATSQGVNSNAAAVAIDILPPNQPPVITSTPPTSARQSNFRYQVTEPIRTSGMR